MNKYINNLKQNTYILQIITLMSGTIIAQIVTFAFIPILTRLYTPSEFGVYALFFSVVSILGLVSSLKYDQAIMLPKSDKDAQSLVFLSMMLTLGMVLLVSIGLFLFYDFFVDYFDGLSHVIWMIPIGILLMGLFQIFSAYSSRQQFYKKQATVRVANSFTLVGIQSISKYAFKFDGLILGKLTADAVSVFLLLKYHLKKQTLQLQSLSRRRLRANVKRYDHFPKYQSFTVFLNAISQSIPILFLASFYSAEIAGFYSLTYRVLHVPAGLIGSSTREVYYQKASKLHAAGEDIFNLYLKTTLGLLKIFILPFFTILFFGEYLFDFVFGDEWGMSGTFAQILIIWYLFGFINVPSIVTFSILNLQKVQMQLEFISLILRFFSIYAGFYFFNSYIVSLLFFALSSVTINVFVILFIYFKLKRRKNVV